VTARSRPVRRPRSRPADPRVEPSPEAPSGPSEFRTTRQRSERFALDRFLFFSDAVFAIAITLLVIDLRLPAESLVNGAPQQPLSEVLEGLSGNFAGFIISFLVIASYWRTHHRLFQYVERVDSRLTSIGIALLSGVAFTPFAASVFASYSGTEDGVVFYASTQGVVGALLAAMWWYVLLGRLSFPEIDRRYLRFQAVRSSLLPLAFLLSIPVAGQGVAELMWTVGALAAIGLDLRYRRLKPWPAEPAVGPAPVRKG
jgi:uncharacterized membrane protein